ncbi:hypothetical protein PsorP6_016706 [Peronosclerospora sorghi]|uniref:Uncharacterized protein n=1 Tax=Peronosclerospora sorghi TaxID=230839 RepID=A0ACC0WD60_9STRA|nr:hypothetical protein PsorP6_016706 [Peronosclerospora sorghi]
MTEDKTTARRSQRLNKFAPPSFRVLVRLFSALEFGLRTLTLYQHTPDFAAVKRAVESSCQLSFTPAHLQQIIHLLPGAYFLEWKKKTYTARRQKHVEVEDLNLSQRQQLKQVLTIRKKQLSPADDEEESLEDRITLFYSQANRYLEIQMEAIKREFPDISDVELKDALNCLEVEKSPLPKVREDTAMNTTLLEQKKEKKQEFGLTNTKVKEKLEEALAKPVPQDLKSLPVWLINRVRIDEVGRNIEAKSSADLLKKRLLSTLPQLSDQLQSLVMVTRKSIFPKAYVLRRLMTRAPIKGKVEEQLYLLESVVPEWLTIVLDDSNEYLKISTSFKYCTIKASLRRAISTQI